MHLIRSVLALALVAAVAALTSFPAAAGHVVIVLTPPQPVLSPPTGYVPPPATPGYPPPVGAPTPTQPLPPQVTHWTPPQAVPVIIPDPAPHHR
jgi:hypothetical protein